MDNNQINNGEELASQFSHIKGWGVDADPHNNPTYPMKRYNGSDHLRSNYKRPPLQEPTVEILKTLERKDLSATFGTSVPPRGLSGMIRRWAFKYNEDSYAHWLPLIIADRVNMVEGVVEDIAHGHVPNLVKEYGWPSEWKYNRKKFALKIGIAAAIIGGAIALTTMKSSKTKPGN